MREHPAQSVDLFTFLGPGLRQSRTGSRFACFAGATIAENFGRGGSGARAGLLSVALRHRNTSLLVNLTNIIQQIV